MFARSTSHARFERGSNETEHVAAKDQRLIQLDIVDTHAMSFAIAARDSLPLRTHLPRLFSQE